VKRRASVAALGLATALLVAAPSVRPVRGEPPVPLDLGFLTAPSQWSPVEDEATSDPEVTPERRDLQLVIFEQPDAPDPLRSRYLTLTTSLTDRERFDLRTFLDGGERWHLLEFGAVASSRPLGTRLTVGGHIPYLAGETREAFRPVEYEDSPGAFRLTAEAGGFAAGAEYRSVGKRLERVIKQPAWQDREGGEVWVAQRLGPLRLRLSHSDLTDNVDRDPALPRTTKEQTAVTAEIASSPWPVLGLTYAVGDSERVRLTGDSPAERQAYESLTASAYHAGSGWSVAASSTLSQIRDVARPDIESETIYHEISLELRPLDAVYLIPALTLGQERYGGSSVEGETGSGSLTLAYDPPKQRWRASTTVSYTMNRTSDGQVDGRSIGASGALAWDLGKLLGRHVTLTFEAGHDQYRDRVYPSASSQSLFGFVLLQFASF
jgi:hypothetical protein